MANGGREETSRASCKGRKQERHLARRLPMLVAKCHERKGEKRKGMECNKEGRQQHFLAKGRSRNELSKRNRTLPVAAN